MIGNNDSVVQGKLDGIRSKRQRFVSVRICVGGDDSQS